MRAVCSQAAEGIDATHNCETIELAICRARITPLERKACQIVTQVLPVVVSSGDNDYV